MVLDKVFGLDGIVIKKFIIYWEIIGFDYIEMIWVVIILGLFLKGVCSGFIIFM